jgi:hypothetical protein
MTDPFHITGPAIISFSGGRTSAKMLKRIIDAHGGSLPDDVYVTFANTGLEHEKTLRFVHECATRWAVRIRWLEWKSRLKRTPVAERFEEVGFNSASRNGEPFDRLIDSKKALPNQAQRFCTEHLKVQVMQDFMRHEAGLEPGQYTEVIGLRADEFWRYAKGRERAEKEGRLVAYPLIAAKVCKPDVMAFWLGENTDPLAPTLPLPQGFDLGLRGIDGNCRLCFMKGPDAIGALIREEPGMEGWYVRAEKRTGHTFRDQRPIETIAKDVARQPDLWADPDEFDAECGTWCGEAA